MMSSSLYELNNKKTDDELNNTKPDKQSNTRPDEQNNTKKLGLTSNFGNLNREEERLIIEKRNRSKLRKQNDKISFTSSSDELSNKNFHNNIPYLYERSKESIKRNQSKQQRKNYKSRQRMSSRSSSVELSNKNKFHNINIPYFTDQKREKERLEKKEIDDQRNKKQKKKRRRNSERYCSSSSSSSNSYRSTMNERSDRKRNCYRCKNKSHRPSRRRSRDKTRSRSRSRDKTRSRSRSRTRDKYSMGNVPCIHSMMAATPDLPLNYFNCAAPILSTTFTDPRRFSYFDPTVPTFSPMVGALPDRYFPITCTGPPRFPHFYPMGPFPSNRCHALPNRYPYPFPMQNFRRPRRF